MKRLLFCISFIGCISILTGCFIKKNPPEKIWFYVDGSNLSREYDDITPASFLNLQPDGTYTSYFTHFDYGKWTIKNNHVTLISNTTINITYNLKYPSTNEMQLQTPDQSVLNFEGRPSSSSEETNPFSLKNNHWRIPAKEKENEKQIRERLYNHFLFQEQYFRWALEKKINSIDVRSTPSLIKMYGNGFQLKPVDDLPVAWKQLFFDEEDCKTATAIVKNIFDHSDIIWPQTDNKFKMFASAFQQLQKLVREE